MPFLGYFKGDILGAFVLFICRFLRSPFHVWKQGIPLIGVSKPNNPSTLLCHQREAKLSAVCLQQHMNKYQNYINKWQFFLGELKLYPKPQITAFFLSFFSPHCSTHYGHHMTGITAIIYLFTLLESSHQSSVATYSVVSSTKAPCQMKYTIYLSSAAFPLLWQPVAICKCSG